MIGSTWSHAVARPMARLLAGLGVGANLLAGLRLSAGLLAAFCLLPGTPAGNHWGGWLWLSVVPLNRLYKEIAQVTGLATTDSFVDELACLAFFAAMGFGQRHSILGVEAIPIGMLSGIALLMSFDFSAALRQRQKSFVIAPLRRLGLAADDLLVVFAPLAWLDWLAQTLIVTVLGGTIIALLSGWRLWRLMAQEHRAESDSPLKKGDR